MKTGQTKNGLGSASSVSKHGNMSHSYSLVTQNLVPVAYGFHNNVPRKLKGKTQCHALQFL